MKKVYRIFEIKNGKVMSLFHSTNGSRSLPLDTWIKADIKTVKDGSRKSRFYTSGFHILLSKEEADLFFEKMFKIKENRYVVPCYVRGEIRRKHPEGARGVQPCWLSDEILIKFDDVKDLI